MNKTLLALSIAGASFCFTSASFAQSIVSGSTTVVLMNGASQSIGAELQVSDSLTFTGGVSENIGAQVAGAVVVTPELSRVGNGPQGRLARNFQDFEEIVVDGGLPDASLIAGTPTTFTAAAAAALVNATNNGTLADEVSIIRAGAGVDGLD